VSGFEYRHWRVCDRGAEAAEETPRTTLKKEDWDGNEHLGWHYSQEQEQPTFGPHSREGQLPSDSPVGGPQVPMAHECRDVTRETKWDDGHLEILALLDVRPFELWECVLSIVGMGRGGTLEIFFNPLSCAVLRFLLHRLESGIPNPARSASSTFSAVRGFIMSIVSVFRKACRA
jgi:hypothetical protein